MRLVWILACSTSLLVGRETENEDLFLRRIADFWQEGEYQIAKSQMEEFIKAHPDSSFKDPICASLGDLFLKEKNISTALNYYIEVSSLEFLNKIFLNKMQCLYEMGWYVTLTEECEAFLSEKNLGEDERLYPTYFLALGLYHQCINAEKESDLSKSTAQKALPFFEMLYQTDLKKEVAEGFAYLFSITKEYEKAAKIYQELVDAEEEKKEERLFQLGVIQSEYDKEKALETFSHIALMKGEKEKEAHYNRIVLSYELKKFKELVEEDLSEALPKGRIDLAHLFKGKAYLALKEEEKAIEELKTYIEKAEVSEALYAALFSLIDASFQSKNLDSLEVGVEKLKKYYPNDKELPQVYFSKAQLLKRKDRLEEAQNLLQETLKTHLDFPQRKQMTFEALHLSYQRKDWQNCYELGKAFVALWPQDELSPFAWRYTLFSSSEIFSQNQSHAPKLFDDLEAFFSTDLSLKEKKEWELLRAKTHFDLKNFSTVIALLENGSSPNEKLLLALSLYQNSLEDKDPSSFLNEGEICASLEEALEKKADLIAPGKVHTLLYNLYMKAGDKEKSVDHLFKAFSEKEEINLGNLLWLSEHYFSHFLEDDTNFILGARALHLLKASIEKIKEPKTFIESAFLLEPSICKLAKVYSILGNIDEAISLLSALKTPGDEPKLLLAENLVQKGEYEKAKGLFDEVTQKGNFIFSPSYASAALQGAKLKLHLKGEDRAAIASQLKTLILQKNFRTEPNHLEAALEYIDLQSKGDVKKRLSLFKKTKEDFTKETDLLSKDYHIEKKLNPKKEEMFQNYMKFIDANIFHLEAANLKNQELDKEAKDLLVEVSKSKNSPLTLKMRTKNLLEKI